MHAVQTIAINDPVTWASLSLPVMHTTVRTRSPDGATLMQLLLHYCSNLLMFCCIFLC